MEALEVIVEETQSKLLRKVILEVIDSLRAGDTFATAAAAHPEAFPNFYVGILESAELTGNLDEVLNQLADYIERDQKARSKITAALIYPAVVACMSVVTVLVLAVFVLPRFTVFLNRLTPNFPLLRA
jgi:type IV pilus assembly protein PilC